MREKRLGQFPADYFNTIIIDEAHHSISDSYQKILAHFDKARVLGVTATPDRGDMKNLGQVFGSLAYEYTLPKAIKAGYLSPIKALTIPLKLDLSGVAMQSGDFKAGDIATALDPYLYQIADEMEKYCKNRKTVVFLPLVKTSQKFRDILIEKRFKAAEVNGESKDRAEVLEAFDRGDYNVLCNSMLLTEGWDCPSVDCIVVLRPTKVRSLYSQMVGRGTRLHPGKEHLLLLDFLWHTERHELCHPADLICTDREVAQKMTDNMEETCGCPVDIEEAEKKASEDVIAEREESLAKQLREMRNRKKKLVDPLQFEMSIQAEDLAGYVPAFGWELAPPSDSQKKELEKRGIRMILTMRCCASSTSFILTLVVISRSACTVSAIRFDMLEKNTCFISSDALLSAYTISLGSQSRTKRCTERSSISRIFSNTNILSRMLWDRSGLILSISSNMRFSLVRSTWFMISAT